MSTDTSFEKFKINYPLEIFKYNGIGNINTSLQYQQLKKYFTLTYGYFWEIEQLQHPKINSSFLDTFNNMLIENWKIKIGLLEDKIKENEIKFILIKEMLIFNTKLDSTYWVNDIDNYPIYINLRDKLEKLIDKKRFVSKQIKLQNMADGKLTCLTLLL